MFRASIIGLVLSTLLLGTVVAAEAKNSLGAAESDVALGFSRRGLAELNEALKAAEVANDSRAIAVATGALGEAELDAHADNARQHLEKSVSLARQQGFKDVLARSANNLGNLEARLGHDAAAFALYRDAEAAAATDEPLLRATIGINLARSLLAQGKTREAVARLTSIHNDLAPLPPSAQQGFLLIGLGRLAATQSRGESAKSALAVLAVAALERAESVAKCTGNARLASLSEGYLGELMEEKGQPEKAAQHADRAVFQAQLAEAPDLLYRWEWLNGRLLVRAGRTDQAVGAYRRAVRALESVRHDIPVEYHEGRSSYFEKVGPLYYQLVDLLLRSSHGTVQADGQQVLLREVRDTLETLKVVELRDYFGDPCLEAPEQHAAQSETQDSTGSASVAILYPVSLEDRLELVLFTAHGAFPYTVPVSKSKLRDTVRTLRSSLETRVNNRYKAPARQLYDWLVRPAEDALRTEKVDTIVFVPDGFLRTIPLTALMDGDKYLVERYAVAVSPALSVIETHPKRVPVAGRALFAGLTVPVQGFPALPAVRGEIDAASSIQPGPVLLDDRFVSSRLVGDLGDRAISTVHIASHGKFDHDPAKSFLLAYDGKLTIDQLDEAIRQRDPAADLVDLLILSACETAAGDDRAALGLAGIALRAGARSAVASLWSVNDEATRELIAGFYNALRKDGRSKAEALRTAQLLVLQDERFRHPAYWAPFMLIGDWR